MSVTRTSEARDQGSTTDEPLRAWNEISSEGSLRDGRGTRMKIVAVLPVGVLVCSADDACMDELE